MRGTGGAALKRGLHTGRRSENPLYWKKGVEAMLDFRMRTFLEVCRCLNYTRAAEKLNITQPAVTQHIQYLQEYYGVKLFAYRNKQLALTAGGAALRDAAVTMLHDEEKLRRDLQDLQGGKRSLRFGATLTIGAYALPGRLAAYIKRHPEIRIHILVENTQVLLRELDEGRLDFALVEGYFRKDAYDFLVWAVEPYICVCAAGHPLPEGQVRLEDLFCENLILRNPGSGSREVLVRVLEERNYCPDDFCHVVEVSDLKLIKELVKADCGVSFLYRRAAERELAEGTLRQVPLADFHVEHEFTFLWRKGSVFESEFRQLFKELCEPFG